MLSKSKGHVKVWTCRIRVPNIILYPVLNGMVNMIQVGRAYNDQAVDRQYQSTGTYYFSRLILSAFSNSVPSARDCFTFPLAEEGEGQLRVDYNSVICLRILFDDRFCNLIFH